MFSPEEIVRKARDAGLTTIAITDHDIIDGIEPALAEGKKLGIKVIPGIEFTTDLPETEIHILGYFIDYKAEWLKELLSKIREDRKTRVYKIVEKLKKLGADVSAEEILALTGEGSVGRPHVARALMNAGFVKTIQEAFNKYLNNNGPAYVQHFRLTPVDAIHTIIKAGGIPVFAHPAVSKRDELIPELAAEGLAGIEVYYGKHSELQVKHYLAIAKKNGLLMTGGTDFHGLGTGRDIQLGDIKLNDKFITKLEERLKK
jgi:hypothetical protein